mgnify:CR=1 FL=1
MADRVREGIVRVVRFLKRQKRNYRVAVARSSASSFLANLTGQYSSIYTVGLGADSVQLGSISSISSAISALIATPVGWLVDRHGIKRFYLLSILFMAGGALIYGLARDWRAIIVASALAAIAMRLSGTGCSVICADSVQNKDRVTAQNLCGSLAAIFSLISPWLGALLVTRYGGINVEGIRPLFYLRFVGYGLVFLLVATQLREPQRERLARSGMKLAFVADFRQLFKGRGFLWRWVLLASITALPMAMY